MGFRVWLSVEDLIVITELLSQTVSWGAVGAFVRRCFVGAGDVLPLALLFPGRCER